MLSRILNGSGHASLTQQHPVVVQLFTLFPGIQPQQIIHLQASGGHFGGNDPASKWLRTVFTFIGCEFQQYAAEGMDHEPERADEIMRDALEAVRQLGRDCLSRPAGRPS